MLSHGVRHQKGGGHMSGMSVNKLKGKIVEKGLSIKTLADLIGIYRATLYRKLSNNGDTLLVREANSIVSALNLSSDEAVAIFFNPDVA